MSNIDKRKRMTLCWKCRNATNSGCSWSRSLTPVEGWTAIEDHLCTNYRDNTSYLVTDCPQFIQDDAMRCEVCKFFEIKGEVTMYGYCRKRKTATDINRSCEFAKRVGK